MNDSIQLRYLPGTPGPTRPARPLDVRLRQALIGWLRALVNFVTEAA